MHFIVYKRQKVVVFVVYKRQNVYLCTGFSKKKGNYDEGFD